MLSTFTEQSEINVAYALVMKDKVKHLQNKSYRLLGNINSPLIQLTTTVTVTVILNCYCPA